jgi:hypothetical protein
MEQSGGEPDVVDVDAATGEFIFGDCSAQSPKRRRSVCSDRDALETRKEHKPKNSAVDMATAMGAALLTEAEYRRLASSAGCSGAQMTLTLWRGDQLLGSSTAAFGAYSSHSRQTVKQQRHRAPSPNPHVGSSRP